MLRTKTDALSSGYYAPTSSTKSFKYTLPKKISLEKKSTKQLIYVSATFPVTKFNLVPLENKKPNSLDFMCR